MGEKNPKLRLRGNMKRRVKKKAVTLIEIMIVILLIGLIGGALAFNMRGSMDKGKIFKTEQHCARVYDALMMEYAKGDKTLAQIVEDKINIMKETPIAKDGEKFLKEAWGVELDIQVDQTNDDLVISRKKSGT